MNQMLQQTDDSELAAAALRGDRVAFGRLIERHYDMIYRIAYRTLGSKADAEDIAQDVCITLANKLGNFAGRSRFTTWLTSIVINQCRDFLRRRKSSAALVEKYVVQRTIEEAGEEAGEDDAEGRSRWLNEELGKLEPALRETVVLVVAEELSHAEAAEILGCAESTVSWRMHMVKKALRARKDDDDE
jgi:RNA polymerase sigma-70 factor (ECF subfamily)